MFFIVSTLYLTASDVIFAEKKEEKNGENGNSLFIIPEEGIEDGRTMISLAYNNFILAESSPCFVDIQTLGVKTGERRDDIISYKVQAGENVIMIAEKLGISADTIRWANNIKGNAVKEGEELLILPTTGTIYYVERGDTIGEIAKIHKADEKEIVAFNNIVDGRISAGERMIIPGGTPPPPPPPPPASSPSSPRITAPQTRVASSGFINPVPGGMITQGVHPYNAVDIYQPCGYPIVAAASGRVIEVSIGTWAGGAGNFVKIDHGEVIAVYSHMQAIYVSTGDYVSQGRQIGTVGNTGRTVGRTGCHLHFDILSLRIRNPFGHLPVGTRL